MQRQMELLAIALTMLLSLSSHPGYSATIGFKPAVNYAVGTAPRAVVSGDVNGDRTMDVVIANNGDPNMNDDGGLSISFENGDGTFQSPNKIVVGKNPCPGLYLPCLIAADYNGDGRLDLAVLKANNTLGVLLGNGDGTFQTHADYATGNGAIALRIGDVNSDRRPDLIVLESGANSVGILLGNGDGTFQSRTGHPTGSNTASLAVIDVNNDGKLDLVMTEGSLGIETVFGNGDGTFQPGIYCTCGTQSKNIPGPMEAADFNGDNRMDLAVLFLDMRDVNNPFREEIVLLGNGDGTFQPIDTGFRARGSVPTSAAITDFDGDGHSDLAVGLSGAAYVLLGNGDGTFQPPATFDLGSVNDYSTAIAAADMNSDKSPDVIVTNALDNTISVLLNTMGAEFSISASTPNPAIVSRGQSSTSTVTLSSQNGLNTPVDLTCSVQPTQLAPTCSVNPSSVTFDANGNATATLTINTGVATASLLPTFLNHDFALQFLCFPVAGFALMRVGFGSRRFSRSRLRGGLLSCILLAGLTFETACGGGNGDPASTTTYTITVTGMSGSTQHSVTTVLKVQ